MKKYKLLISAYGCEPFRGSEAGVGWNWVVQLAKSNELHVIVRKNDKEKIEKNLPNEIKSNIHFYYYDNPIFLRFKYKEKGLYLYYTIWQIGIYKIAKKLCLENKFDYTMHLSFGSFWMPTLLPFLNVPFIWGPLGGGECVPKELLEILPAKIKFIQSIRYFLIKTSKGNPLITIPSKKASFILCRTENNLDVVPEKYRKKAYVILETAMEKEVFEFSKKDSKSSTISFIMTGRLIPSKNIMLSLQTFNLLKEKYKNIHLTIIGKGEEKSKIIRYINENSLNNYVTVHDFMPREEVFRELEKSDIYLFPSLVEGGSWALMEAMAIGLPVICLDWAGMKIITDDDSAIRIMPCDFDSLLIENYKACEKLILNRALRKEMGNHGRCRIRTEFNWKKKAEFLQELLN